MRFHDVNLAGPNSVGKTAEMSWMLRRVSQLRPHDESVVRPILGHDEKEGSPVVSQEGRRHERTIELRIIFSPDQRGAVHGPHK